MGLNSRPAVPAGADPDDVFARIILVGLNVERRAYAVTSAIDGRTQERYQELSSGTL